MKCFKISPYAIAGERADRILSYLESAYSLDVIPIQQSTIKRRIECLNVAIRADLEKASCKIHDWDKALFVDSNHVRPKEIIDFCRNCGDIKE